MYDELLCCNNAQISVTKKYSFCIYKKTIYEYYHNTLLIYFTHITKSATLNR